MSQIIQVKRTDVAGRTPNTTNVANDQYIYPGELALNLADQKLFSSNGTTLIEFGTGTPVYDANGAQITALYIPINSLSALATNLVPITNAAYTVGQASYRFTQGFFSTSVDVGNSSVNTTITPASITTGGVVGAGNTTVTGFLNVSSYGTFGGTVNTTALNIGANVYLTSSDVNVGNSSVNTQLTSNTLKLNGKQAINGPAFAAYADNTAQNITSGSQQKILFQVEEFDTNNNFANSRFTPTVAGYYQLNAEVRFDGSFGTGETMIVVWKNGSEYKRGWNASGVNWATNFGAMTVSTLVYANGTTDYFEIYAQQTSGSTMTVTAVNSQNITWFNGAMVRGA